MKFDLTCRQSSTALCFVDVAQLRQLQLIPVRSQACAFSGETRQHGSGAGLDERTGRRRRGNLPRGVRRVPGGDHSRVARSAAARRDVSPVSSSTHLC